MRRASATNERFLVDRNGEPTVMILSVKDYMDTFAPEPNWLARIRAKSKQNGTDKLTMPEIDRIISEVRRKAKKTDNTTVK